MGANGRNANMIIAITELRENYQFEKLVTGKATSVVIQRIK